MIRSRKSDCLLFSLHLGAQQFDGRLGEPSLPELDLVGPVLGAGH
jgi:hypothetical protein